MISLFSLVNFPVVAGGFALIAVIGTTQAAGALGTATLPILSPSFVGGAAALLGNDLNLKVKRIYLNLDITNIKIH